MQRSRSNRAPAPTVLDLDQLIEPQRFRSKNGVIYVLRKSRSWVSRQAIRPEAIVKTPRLGEVIVCRLAMNHGDACKRGSNKRNRAFTGRMLAQIAPVHPVRFWNVENTAALLRERQVPESMQARKYILPWPERG